MRRLVYTIFKVYHTLRVREAAGITPHFSARHGSWIMDHGPLEVLFLFMNAACDDIPIT